ncbi:hypothetical protein [Candidatus Electronema sp. PJ]|uniref:hypothetical protein n=1 Tax=Candidatus Electronema sp. PJ TaxID=3401572 RepID=UPI003AA7ADE6
MKPDQEKVLREESVTIPRKKKGEGDEYEFSGLRRLGLEYVQQLSGKIWTDYNLHDPGVTILEHLCYALTDLIYRADYTVPDLLTDSQGELHYESLALHPPEEIFPSRAVTLDDYRRVLFDELPDISNIWLEPLARAENLYCGLYRILAAPVLTDGDCDLDQQQLIEKIAKIFARHRNLCEDIGEIVILQPVPCHLEARVRISSAVLPEEILAEIYYRCGLATADWLKLEPYLTEKDDRPEDIFNGPLASRGRVRGLRDSRKRGLPSRVQLFSLLKEIDGVEEIERLALHEDKAELAKVMHSGRLPCYQLRIPDTKETVRVLLTRNGRTAAFSYKRFKARHDELTFKYRIQRQQKQNVVLHEAPRGMYRNPGGYFSVQNLFPAIYGINRYGVPEHYPDKAKAEAAQLKAYLLPFEQIMADCLAQLENIPRLFSAHKDLRCSYYRQNLDSSMVSGIDKVLKPDAAAYLADLNSRFDNYRDRKNRLLDYLLALYGERFTGTSLRSFNFYQQPDEFEDHLIDCKARLLRHIVQVSRDRSGAFNYSEPAWNTTNTSGLQHKVSLLLGWEHATCRPLTQFLFGQKLKMVTMADEHDCQRLCKEACSRCQEDEPAGLESVPLLDSPDDETLSSLREQLKGFHLLASNLVCPSLLMEGAHLKQYRLCILSSGSVSVLFQPDKEKPKKFMGSFADREKAVVAVNALRRFLIRLNQESEGMHLVEHILLRPADIAEATRRAESSTSDFYSHRISVVLPNWTARCGQEHFRQLLEETVRLCCPAQVMPTFCWLTFAQMCEFEWLYAAWLKKKQTLQSGDSALEQAAAKLTDFLLAHQPQEEELW